MSNVVDRSRQQFYADCIRRICILGGTCDSGSSVDENVRFPRLTGLSLIFDPPIGQYVRYLQPHLTDISFGTRPSAQLGSILAERCPQLRSASILDYDISGDQRRTVCSLLTFFQHWPAPSLTELRISCPLPHCPAPQELFVCWAELPRLQQLEMVYEAEGAGLEAASQLHGRQSGVAASAAPLASLTHLCIRLRSGDIKYFVRAAPSLTKLGLTAHAGARADLADLAPLTELRELNVLYLADADARPLTARNVAGLRNLRQLRTLCVFAIFGHQVDGDSPQPDPLTDAEFGSLAAALPYLTNLTLYVSAGARALTGAALRSVGEHCRGLQKLRMDGAWDVTCWRESDASPLFPELKSLELEHVTVAKTVTGETRYEYYYVAIDLCSSSGGYTSLTSLA